ncbi:phosphate ABC transporter substrate-binding protein PstS, partial [Microbacterium sp. CPCC 204701]|uniref:phosphate ABC transporter substrate-binding protein PstS n=1 Tax=Microbacterium sp. CPCC 204701 TaxID=2493084 RepID=UPI0013E2B8F6
MTARTAPRWSSARVIVAIIGVVLITLGSLNLAGAATANAAGQVHAAIRGTGSTWSANALQQWIRNVWSNYQWKITYDETGSTQGRVGFANGTADFGVSEIPYAIENSNEVDPLPARQFAYMPIVAGGTAFMYNLEIGGQRVTNLRLSGDTIAKIFTGAITRWDDPQIKTDNPLLALPAIPIVPVVRSDGSGATAQFSIWMRQEHTALWDAYCGKVGRPMVNGHCGVTSNYPVPPNSAFVSKALSSGVSGYVAQQHAVGAITFVEYSYALNANFPVAKMLNSAGYYTEPTAPNVAVALLSARINEDRSSVNYLTQDLSQVYRSADPRVYPLSSYSYIILPTLLESTFTADKGLTLADFSAYFLCEGQQQADRLGYSPLPINLVQAGQEQIAKVPGGDPAIKGIADCNNPTFSPDGSNRLANEAPFPAECDKAGPTQCLDGTGGTAGTSTGASGGDDAAGGGGDAAAGGGAGEGGAAS